MSTFKMMLKEVYNIPVGEIIYPAPPRQTLLMFNNKSGISIDEFRKQSKTCHVEIVNPPMFVLTDITTISSRNKKEESINRNVKTKENGKLLTRTKPMPNARNNIGNFFGLKKK